MAKILRDFPARPASPAQRRRFERAVTTRSFVVALLLAILGLVVPTWPAHAEPSPDESFYTPPPGFESVSPGTILAERPVELAIATTLPYNVAAWQLLYRTTDRDGAPIATVATVMLPAGPEPAGPRPLMLWQPFEDASAQHCAPSVTMRRGSNIEGVGGTGDMLSATAALHRGWAVVVPDYEGPGSEFLAPRLPGYAALDAARAAEMFAPLGLEGSSTPVVAYGYSGGSLATVWAAELQPSYAPELDFRGFAVGGPVVDPGDLPEKLSGGPFSGIGLIALAGFRHSYPAVRATMDRYLTPVGRDVLDRTEQSCAVISGLAGSLTAYDTLFTVPFAQVWSDPAVVAARDDARPGGQAPTTPMYVAAAVHDQLARINAVDAYVARHCAAGAQVTFRRDAFSEHIGLSLTAVADAMNWLAERIVGTPLSPGCDIASVTSTALEPGAPATTLQQNIDTVRTLLGLPIGPS